MTTVIIDIAVEADRVAFIGQDLDLTFKPITSADELNTEIDFGAKMDAINEAVAAHGTKMIYLDIARVVHLAQQVAKGSKDLQDAFNTACANRGAPAVTNEKANPYIRHTWLLMSRKSKVDATSYVMDGKWKNLLRAIRYLIDKKVAPNDVPNFIQTVTAKDSKGKTLTRLQALNELDKQAHKPAKSSAVNRYGSAQAETTIKAADPVAIIGRSVSFNYNEEGFALVVVRKGKNGTGEVLFDAVMDDKYIMKGVREGFKATVAKAEVEMAEAEMATVERIAA